MSRAPSGRRCDGKAQSARWGLTEKRSLCSPPHGKPHSVREQSLKVRLSARSDPKPQFGDPGATRPAVWRAVAWAHLPSWAVFHSAPHSGGRLPRTPSGRRCEGKAHFVCKSLGCVRDRHHRSVGDRHTAHLTHWHVRSHRSSQTRTKGYPFGIRATRAMGDNMDVIGQLRGVGGTACKVTWVHAVACVCVIGLAILLPQLA